jgi:D-glycero-D-manno-heptose 1,7-bisphosphate phosphatase
MNKAVFLDRDGTINTEVDYLSTVEGFIFLPGALAALVRLAKTKYKIIIVTNQSGIGRGYFTEERLKEINVKMCCLLEKAGGRIDAIYYCPHRPDENCSCRKPKTGMIEDAKKDFTIDLAASYMIGDATRDVQLAINAGCTSILVETGKGGEDGEYPACPDHRVKDLGGAVDLIIGSKTNINRGKKHGTRKHA